MQDCDIYIIYIYMEVRMSLLVARAPHYVKEAELDHSLFLGWRQAELSIYHWIWYVRAPRMF